MSLNHFFARDEKLQFYGTKANIEERTVKGCFLPKLSMSVKVDYIFKTLGILVYVGSMVGGIYFIYQGEIVQRFNLKRTNFAIYSEPIVE